MAQPKLQAHMHSCSASHLTCIDCNVTFKRHEVQGHTKCVTEHEKYAQGVTKAPGYTAPPPKPPGNGKPLSLGEFEPPLPNGPPWKCRHALSFVAYLGFQLRSSVSSIAKSHSHQGLIAPRCKYCLQSLQEPRCSASVFRREVSSMIDITHQFICCSICNVTCTSRDTLKGHIGGAKHIRKASSIEKLASTLCLDICLSCLIARSCRQKQHRGQGQAMARPLLIV